MQVLQVWSNDGGKVVRCQCQSAACQPDLLSEEEEVHQVGREDQAKEWRWHLGGKENLQNHTHIHITQVRGRPHIDGDM